MFAMLYKNLHNKKGFTLTEIMTCVIVLGILTAVAVPIFSLSVKKQRVQECQLNRQMVTTTVRNVMAGMTDNGAKQEYITVMCTFSEGRHKVYETTDRIDKKGQVVKDNDGNVIKDKVYDWNGNAMFKYENHIDNAEPKCICDVCGADMHKDTNGDGKCDKCNVEGVQNKKYLTSANHIDQSHLVYKDADGNNLTTYTDYGVELNESSATAIESYTSFLRLDLATVGDIRGGYRYAEVRDTYLKTYMDAQTKKALELQEIDKKETGISYTQEQKNADIAAIEAKYTAPDELTLNSILSKVQSSNTAAKNNPSYRCSEYDYKHGCNDGYYLKKCSMWITPVYTLFANQEMPRCPFDEDGTKGYFYYIDASGACHCTCPECH